MDGVLIVNKPPQYTSRDVVNVVGKIVKTKQIGHTGTLDPMATGVLILCIGKATKLVELLTSESKEYEVQMQLGIETDTLDKDGKILRQEVVPEITKEQVLHALHHFLGMQKQEVPIYSAIKVNGKKLYEYARANEKVELPIRDISVYNIELIHFKSPYLTFKTHVSKGTYIRSLVRDIAHELNTIGVMTSLTRTKQGEISIIEAVTLEDIERGNYQIRKMEEMLSLPKVIVDQDMLSKIKNGQVVERFFDSEMVMIMDQNKCLVAIYQTYEKDPSKVKPYKVF